MKTILKLLIAAVVINACARAGVAAMRYYKLKDTAQQAVLFGATSSTEELRQRILDKAVELHLPIQPANVLVRRAGNRTWADASYRYAVELFPNQEYPVNFAFTVEGYSMVLGK
jgi:hypothetical protein